MEFKIVASLDDREIDQLLDLYGNEFWCNKRKRSDVVEMLNNTNIVLGAKNGTNDLVGFVRVLTDYMYKATIFDLIVHPKWRGKDIGKLLMDTIVDHQRLRNVEHFDLNCLPEMYPFYERWGFTAEVGDLGFMRKFNYEQ